LTQAPEQLVVGGEHPQSPPPHWAPPVHFAPQTPQLFPSCDTSTHDRVQRASAPVQVGAH
jgi:hypothetical protein